MAVKGRLASLGAAALRPLTALPAHCRRASRVAGRDPFEGRNQAQLSPLELAFRDTAMSKTDELRYGAPGETAVHLCVDMQRMFAEGTEWKMPWLERVLPNIVSITSAHPERTIFTRFIPARKARPGRRHVAALLRAMGLHDHRPARP